MPTKFLNFDFYSVSVVDSEARSFGDLLRTLERLPDDETRAMHRAEDAIRMQSVRHQAPFWRGESLRIRLNETPIKATLSGRTQDVELREDEGIGEETAFLFHDQTNVICIQRNRSGVSASALAKYMKVKSQSRSVRFNPLMKQDALVRLERMHRVTKFELKFAGVQNGTPLHGRGHSARSIFSMLNEFEAPNASITLSVGRRPGGLRNVVEAVQGLITGNNGDNPELKKVIVIGSEDGDEEKTVIDLFEDRLTETVTVEVDNGQRLTPTQRTRATREAWDRQGEYILQFYQPEV